MKKILISICSNKLRGIFNVANNLKLMLDEKYNSELKYPFFLKSQSALKNFAEQIIWESKALNKEDIFKNDYIISVHPRLPFWILFNRKVLNCKIGIFVHDYMQCFNFKNLNKKFIEIRGLSLFQKFKFLIFSSYHTLIFKLSIQKADFILFNSNYTKFNLKNWAKQKSFKTLVLHPLPSFHPNELESYFQKLKNLENKNYEDINILFVSSNTPNKRSHLIIPLCNKIASKFKNFKFNFYIIGAILNTNKSSSHDLNLKIFDKQITNIKLIEIYLKANFFITTSCEEGFGIPLLDALLFDIFSIASNIQSYKELYSNYPNKHLYLIDDFNNLDSYLNPLEKLLMNKLIIDKEYRLKNYCKNYNSIFDKSSSKLDQFLRSI